MDRFEKLQQDKEKLKKEWEDTLQENREKFEQDI